MHRAAIHATGDPKYINNYNLLQMTIRYRLQVVGGSNPLAPTNFKISRLGRYYRFFLLAADFPKKFDIPLKQRLKCLADHLRKNQVVGRYATIIVDFH